MSVGAYALPSSVSDAPPASGEKGVMCVHDTWFSTLPGSVARRGGNRHRVCEGAGEGLAEGDESKGDGDAQFWEGSFKTGSLKSRFWVKAGGSECFSDVLNVVTGGYVCGLAGGRIGGWWKEEAP